MDMARRRMTIIEAMEFGLLMPRYDRRGRRMPTRAEWGQFSRWRRWRDLLLGWEPYKPRPLPWEER
jgi:hypothetical protein